MSNLSGYHEAQKHACTKVKRLSAVRRGKNQQIAKHWKELHGGLNTSETHIMINSLFSSNKNMPTLPTFDHWQTFLENNHQSSQAMKKVVMIDHIEALGS